MATIKHVLFSREGTNELLTGEAIEHAGEWWLVAGWNVTLDGKEQQPLRMIALAPFRTTPSRFAGHDLFAQRPISKDVLEGPGLPEETSGFRVLILPDLWIETPSLQ